MRRPVTILAGLLLAAGSTFAFASAASAAVSHDSHATIAGDYPYDWFGNDGDEFDQDFDGEVSGEYDFDSRINQDVDSNSNPDIRIYNNNRSNADSDSDSDSDSTLDSAFDLVNKALGGDADGGDGGEGGEGGEGGAGIKIPLFG